MTEKYEALRLAYALEISSNHGMRREAAAELRRLHQHEVALSEWLDKTSWLQETARPGELGMHRADAMRARMLKADAQRGALLEALRVFVSCALPVSTEIDERGHRWTEAYLDQALPIARAAIKAVEGEKE